MILSQPYTHYIVLAIILIEHLTNHFANPKKVVTNKMRYAIGDNNNLPLSNMLELAAAASSSSIGAKYLFKTNRKNPITKLSSHQDVSAIRSLDDEDRGLLDKFYRETKKGDPFQSDSFSTNSLWDDQAANGFMALTDSDSGAGELIGSDWTFDPNINEIDQRLKPSLPSNELNESSGYSPTLRLLTSYDPISENESQEDEPKQIAAASRQRTNRIVGATLYGKSVGSRPDLSSKSALDAIKMHNNLLAPPPKDGIVRVRMYYHRAIHDDVRLYGNGPWKYWGHGWGLEFGYDPKSEKEAKDSYQKGYTIERAYGRDFCKDPKKCRKSDPEFFKDPLKVGHYSRQNAKKLKTNKY